jgi:hypothetical protein
MTLGPDAYDSTQSRATSPPWTRVYRLGGKYAHYEESGTTCPIVNRYLPVDTGWGGDNGWYGTGSQEEYGEAQALPLCLICFRRRESYSPDLRRLGAGHGEEMT